MSGATFATWNTNFRDSPEVVEANVRRLLGGCQVAVLTEARSEGVTAALGALGWDEFRAEGSSDRIVWDPSLWQQSGPHGVVHVHDAGPGKFLPAREVSWATLVHRGSEASHTVMASHVTAGYASPEDLPFMAWREEAARSHLLAIVEETARLLALPKRRRPTFHHLLGDLNARPGRIGAWWWPGRVLDSLYAEDREAGLDYMLHTRASSEAGLRVTRRWTERLGSEGFHPAHFKRVSFPRNLAR